MAGGPSSPVRTPGLRAHTDTATGPPHPAWRFPQSRPPAGLRRPRRASTAGSGCGQSTRHRTPAGTLATGRPSETARSRPRTEVAAARGTGPYSPIGSCGSMNSHSTSVSCARVTQHDPSDQARPRGRNPQIDHCPIRALTRPEWRTRHSTPGPPSRAATPPVGAAGLPAVRALRPPFPAGPTVLPQFDALTVSQRLTVTARVSSPAPGRLSLSSSGERQVVDREAELRVAAGSTTGLTGQAGSCAGSMSGPGTSGAWAQGLASGWPPSRAGGSTIRSPPIRRTPFTSAARRMPSGGGADTASCAEASRGAAVAPRKARPAAASGVVPWRRRSAGGQEQLARSRPSAGASHATERWNAEPPRVVQTDAVRQHRPVPRSWRHRQPRCPAARPRPPPAHGPVPPPPRHPPRPAAAPAGPGPAPGLRPTAPPRAPETPGRTGGLFVQVGSTRRQHRPGPWVRHVIVDHSLSRCHGMSFRSGTRSKCSCRPWYR